MAGPRRLLDDSRFPIVMYRVPAPCAATFESGDGLLADLEALLRRGEPFVMISSGQHDREPPDIRRSRALWFKENVQRFAPLCKAMIHVERDSDERRRMESRLSTVGRGIGTRFMVVADAATAEALAWSLMAKTEEDKGHGERGRNTQE